MKKLNGRLFAIALIGILLSACSGGSKTAKVKPESTTVAGDLSEYLQIVDNEYEVVDNSGTEGDLSVKVKAIKAFPASDKKIDLINLTASLLGDNGMPVSGTGDFSSGYDYSPKLNSLLNAGSGEIVIKLHAMPGDYKASEQASKVKKFSVSGSISYETPSTTSTTSSNDATGSGEQANAGSQDWDQILKDYDEYTDKYIVLIKKVKQQDMSAMSEYPEMYEKANKLGEELAGAGSSLSSAQMSKMLKIQTKLANAAMEMAK